MKQQANNRSIAVLSIGLLSACALSPAFPAQDTSGVPVFKITPVKSTIRFGVKASVPIEGTFDKWDATLTYTSAHVEDGVLDVKNKTPILLFTPRKLCRPAPIPLTFREHTLFAEFPKTKN